MDCGLFWEVVADWLLIGDLSVIWIIRKKRLHR